MEFEQAKAILVALADGVNPTTGEILSEHDSCNQPSVIRALHLAVRILEKESLKVSKPHPTNAGKPWTTEESNLLIAEYQSGMTGTELAKTHKRSKGAIAARLVRLGVIADRNLLK